MATTMTSSATKEVREIEGKIQLAQRIREQSITILERTRAMRSRLLGTVDPGKDQSAKPEPVRSEIAELEHTMVEAQDILNSVQLHLNDLERI